MEYETLDAISVQLAWEKVCEDVGLFSAFIDQADEAREPCAYFGPISTSALITEVLLKPAATDAQLAAAAREIRARYLTHNLSYVLEVAGEMQQ